MEIHIARPEVEARIVKALDSGDRLIFMVGPRGFGKTTLLRRIQSRLEPTHPTVLIQVEPLAASPEILCEGFLGLAKTVLADVPEHSPSFDHLLNSLCRKRRSSVLLLDELTELRTLSYFPGVEKPLESFLTALCQSHAPKCLATSRFPYWLRTHLEKGLSGIASRIHMIPIPPVSPRELEPTGTDQPERLTALTGGLPLHIVPLLRRLREGDSLEGALAAELAPQGHIEAECRATLSELLHRARGYGACKAVLAVLAERQHLTLSEVARALRRTAGSTRDYLRWLEEVELITASDKRFFMTDPILRVWLRLYARGRPPSEGDIQREVASTVAAVDSVLGARAEGEPHEPATRSEARARAEEFIEID